MKIKRKIFLALAFSYILGLAGISIYFSTNALADKNVFIISCCGLLSFVLLLLLSILFELVIYKTVVTGDFGDKDTHSFIFGLFTLGHNKWIYHSDLGYFLSNIDDNFISVFDQGIFMSHYLFRISNTGNIEGMASEINNRLNGQLSAKREIIRIEKQKYEKIEKVLKEWDGYLDKAGRRDKKIDELLKK
jgi:hypothetical protein